MATTPSHRTRVSSGPRICGPQAWLTSPPLSPLNPVSSGEGTDLVLGSDSLSKNSEHSTYLIEKIFDETMFIKDCKIYSDINNVLAKLAKLHIQIIIFIDIKKWDFLPRMNSNCGSLGDF